MKSLLVHFGLLVLCACVVYGNIIPESCPFERVSAMQNFEVEPYLGLWYEIERYEQFFQLNGDCVTAEYSDNGNGSVRVLNSLVILESLTIRSSEGIAVLADIDSGVGKLNVSFEGSPSTTNYWVIDTDYENYAVVWNCINLGQNLSFQSAWILSRTQEFSFQTRQTVDFFIDDYLQLDRSRLRPTVQDVRCKLDEPQ